jgi:uncharacterized protein (DUF305 family)
MKTYIENMSKRKIAISSLVLGFLLGALVVGTTSDNPRHVKRGGHGPYDRSEKHVNMMDHNRNGKSEDDKMGDIKNSHMNMDDMMKSMISGLQGKTGHEFDQAFLKEMIIHHQGAVDMAKQVLATSKRPELIKLASDIIKAQEMEINLMKKWETEWK